jgi:AraC-like DNA-binding protein
MVRFEEVIADHPNRALHVPELCALIGVSERILRACCAEFLGISPSRYMLLRRLKAVRIALRDADPATASVTEIAGGCGFAELGRFAGPTGLHLASHLRRLYNVLPDQKFSKQLPTLHSQPRNRKSTLPIWSRFARSR